MAKWLLTDGTSQTISILDNPSEDMLSLLQGLVAGLIETVNLDDGWTMIVNEEGLLRDLLMNEAASVLASQYIVGDVVILTKEETEYALY